LTIITSPPEQPRIAEEQLLFHEARRRRQRRRLLAGIVLVVVTAGIVVALVTPGAQAPTRPPASQPPPTPLRPVGAAAIPQIAWVDYNGQLHIGDLSGFTQRVVAQADADPTAPLVTAGGRVFWVRSEQPNSAGTVTAIPKPTVFGFDTGTGQTERIAAGTQVMASASRNFIYVETDYRHLTEYWLNGTPRGRTLTLPNGWFPLNPGLNQNPTPVVANGIVVATWPVAEKNRMLGIWNPSTGRVRVLGKVWQVTATYTAPGARSSLIAWNPASCETPRSCTLKITNTANYSSRVVISPTGHFLWGGSFSPHGSELAAFVSSGAIHGDPTAQLAIVSTQSGALKLVKDVNVYIGDAVAWADWLPDGRHLITGGLTPFGSTVPAVDVLVDSQTDQASPFRFLADRDQDLAMSTVVVP
jgi:hypothetical protein